MFIDIQLPDAAIAREPRARNEAKLLVLRSATGRIEHHKIGDLPGLLGDRYAVVLNDSAVVPSTVDAATGSRVLTWDPLGATWLDHGPPELVVHPRRENTAAAAVERAAPNGSWLPGGRVTFPRYLAHLADEAGNEVPDYYANVYAKAPGSVALPSGGRNLSAALLDEIVAAGSTLDTLTLHVGTITFRHPDPERLGEHRMAAEYYEIPDATVAAVRRARTEGRRVLAVGTTSTRALEDAAWKGWRAAARDTAEIFIRPGHEFGAVDALLTEFHAPETSLLLLVTALAGTEPLRAAYAEALRCQYRWYTLGDSMLIL